MNDLSKAKEEIKSLKAEVERLVGASAYILEHIKPLKASRDELLKWLKSWREGFGALFGNHKNCFDDVDIVIQKAQAMKEKEA